MNRLRSDIEQEEQEHEKELIVEEKPRKVHPENFFTTLFSKDFITTEGATRALPFFLFMSFLGMVYIANRHWAEKTIRDIDKVSKEVKELSWDYNSTKADLAFKSTLSEVSKRTDTLGVKESLQPPQKIIVKEDSK